MLEGLLLIALIIVCVLIGICSIFGFFATIYLWFAYNKFNHKPNKAGITGQQAALKVLEFEGITHIKVLRAGLWATMTVGNSYSHMFKRIRIRRKLWNRATVTALAMGAEKGYLAVLDKEKDPDMVRRNRLIPVVAVGPFAFVLLVLAGFFLDAAILNTDGIVALIISILAVVFYGYVFALSLSVLRVEKKAQERTISELNNAGLITPEEEKDFRKLYGLYNFNYVVDTVMAFLEALRFVLQIALQFAKRKNKK